MPPLIPHPMACPLACPYSSHCSSRPPPFLRRHHRPRPQAKLLWLGEDKQCLLLLPLSVAPPPPLPVTLPLMLAIEPPCSGPCDQSSSNCLPSMQGSEVSCTNHYEFTTTKMINRNRQKQLTEAFFRNRLRCKVTVNDLFSETIYCPPRLIK